MRKPLPLMVAGFFAIPLLGNVPTCESAAREIAQRLGVFQDRALMRDQYVQVGTDDGKTVRLSLTQMDVLTTLPSGSLGRVTARHPNGEDYIIFLPWMPAMSHRGEQGDFVNVAENLIVRTKTGTSRSVTFALQSLLTLQLSFVPGERVRFRDSRGLMQMGVFDGETGGVAIIDQPKFSVASAIPMEFVFKDLGTGEAFTAQFRQGEEFFRYKAPAGVALDFLNGAAKLTSLPDFLKMSDEQRFRTIAGFYKLFTDTNQDFAFYFESSKINDLASTVSCGVVSCFQERVILSTILQEAGYTILINGNLGSEPLPEYQMP